MVYLRVSLVESLQPCAGRVVKQEWLVFGCMPRRWGQRQHVWLAAGVWGVLMHALFGRAVCCAQVAFGALLAYLYTDTITFEEASVVDLACLAHR